MRSLNASRTAPHWTCGQRLPGVARRCSPAGEIAESGTHAELMELGARYAALAAA
jgi:hypothetical protein